VINKTNSNDANAVSENDSIPNASGNREVDSSHGLSLALSAIILILFTVSARSVNNMVVTSVPILSRYVFGFSNLFVGVLSAVIYVTTFITTSYLNPMLARRTRRSVFIGSAVVIPVILLLFYFSSPILIWPLAIASGIVSGFIFPNIITSATVHRDHLVQMRLLAIYSLSLSLSLVIGPSLETWLLGFLNYREVFLPFIALAVLGSAISPFIKFPEVSGEVRGVSTLKNNGFLNAVLANTIYNVPFAAITSFTVIFAVKEFSVSGSVAYSAFIYFFIVSFLTRLLMAVRPFRALFAPLIVSAVLTVVPILLIPEAHSFILFLIIMAVLGIPHGSVFPMASILIARGTSIEERNSANSYFLGYNNILFVIVPIMFGYLGSDIGFGFAFTVLSVIALAATLGLVFLYRKSRNLYTR
jgi:MFS family permease